MKKFLIISNQKKDTRKTIATEVSDIIKKAGGLAYVLQIDQNTLISEENVPSLDEIECVLTIGGDGTFIKAARDLFGYGLKFMGINMGKLGYLAEINPNEFEKVVDKLINDEYELEDRLMLEGKMDDAEVKVALNDIIVHSYGTLNVVSLNVYVNEKFLCNYIADGIIISTPTGSTAYNLSAGGPIVKPGANVIVVTPICPHSTNGRSIILDGSDKIEIEVDKGCESKVSVTFDGYGTDVIPAGKRVVVNKSEAHTDIIKFNSQSFLEILNSKMGDK